MHLHAAAGWRPLERAYGAPHRLRLRQEIGPRELALVQGSTARRRRHDVTFFILEGQRVVVIKKPFFPPGAYRVPSGGVRPDEPFAAGVRREALEETGLEIDLGRYLVRVAAEFSCGPVRERWTTHVFSARPTGDRPLGALDTAEIAEVRWATLDELQGPIRRALLEAGWGLFAYRVALTDAAVARL
jgi:8-oxo-dGTP pyrophosphatase MutT (NUDIX family)